MVGINCDMIKVMKLCNIIPGDYSSAADKVAAKKTIYKNDGNTILDLFLILYPFVRLTQA